MFNRFTCALTTDLHYKCSNNNAFLNASSQLFVSVCLCSKTKSKNKHQLVHCKLLQVAYTVAFSLNCQWVIKVQNAIGVMALIAPLNTIHCN